MLKDNIIQMLDDHRDGIKNSFNVDDNEINNIEEFLNKEHNSFKIIIDDMSKSNLSDRGKMIICCLIGYVNGEIRGRLFEDRKTKIFEDRKTKIFEDRKTKILEKIRRHKK